MWPTKPTRQGKTSAAIRRAPKVEGDGLVEIAILSLAGLTLTVMTVSQGLFSQILPLLEQ
jgi:hypothetical protein